MQRILRTQPLLLLRRIAWLYVLLMLCRVVFYCYNAALIGPLAWSELGTLLRGALLFDTASICYADGAFVLLSLLPLHLREKQWYRNLLFGYYVAVNALLVVVVNLSDAVYFHYTQKRFTADEIFFADNDNSLLLVGKFLVENWWLALLGAGFVWLLAKGYGRRIRPETVLHGWRYYAVSVVIFGIGAALCIAGMRGGITRQTRPITLSNATLYTPESNKANLLLSNPFCILRTMSSGGKIHYVKYFADDELPQYFTPTHQPAEHPAVDLSGRNVMIFIMESMSAEHSALLHPELYPAEVGGGPAGFTQFLDSMMRTGVVCRKMYANGTRSIQAMPSVLGSIPSFRTPFVLMPQSLGESRQLPAILRDMGYTTAFFCGSERGSMGFGAYARSAGIDRLVSREDYEARHGSGDFDGFWGIWDEKFLQFAGEELAEMPEPFFATLFTLTSHHPFVVPEKYADSLPDGYTPIHKGVAYDDMAFRRFFERFGNEPWFRRTLFVFVADHVSSEKYAPATKTYPGNRHIIGFFHTPDGAWQGEIEGVVQQLDIMPTLLGLLGNKEPYFAFGRDLLNEPDRPAWSVSHDGMFRAVTNDGAIQFDDTPNDTLPADTFERSLRALVQQYYLHIEQKRYLPE